MKKSILALIVFWGMGNAFAANPFDGVCRDMSSSSKSIMELRQQGLKQTELIEMLLQTTSNDPEMDLETKQIVNTFITDIVVRAYKVPQYRQVRDQEKAADAFEKKLMSDCQDRLKNLFK